MTTTDHLGLTLVAQNQSQKEVTVNEALVAIDAILNTGVIDKDLTTPPGSPSSGDIYIVAAGATGDWSGKDNQVAYYNQSWKFIDPNEGLLLWVNDEDKLYSFNGTAWVESGLVNNLDDLGDVTLTSVANYHMLQHNGTAFVNTAMPNNLAGVGVNTSADSTNKLAVASDAVLFNHNGGSAQLKMNKNADTDTASCVFQTGFSGRAEFGTVGDDDFQLKVSPDGSTFYQAFVIDKDTGNVDLKKDVTITGTLLNTNMGDYVLSRPELKDYAETRTAASSGTSYTIDLESGNVFEITLTGNCTFSFSNPPATGKGGSFTLILKQDGTGGRTVTWPASVNWAGGSAPALTTTADAIDILAFATTDAGTNWYGFLSGSDMQ